jgi:hypothetical protein
MKTINFFVLFTLIASFSPADEWESFELINRLLTIKEPSAPVIYENAVIFTANSNLRRVGIAFAHENFSNVYWFMRLVLPQNPFNAPIPEGRKVPDPTLDSGLQFYVFMFPENLRELEYRLVINGLWTTDPANSQTRRDPVHGLNMSVLNLPSRPVRHSPLNGLPEGLNFIFDGLPGEIVTVAGNFNGWDPFMYELKEGPAGHYSITIPMPPGTYQYVFFNRGERFPDPTNPTRVYSRDGRSASVVVIP